MAIRGPRSRTSTACDACRSRRTRCDSGRPKCSYCRSHDIECRYQAAPAREPTRVEAELAALNQRLDNLTRLVTNLSSDQRSIDQYRGDSRNLPIAINDSISTYTSPNSGVVALHGARPIFSDDERAPFELLGSRSMMEVLGLPPDLMTRLAVLERSLSPRLLNPAPRFFILGPEQATRALAAFSNHIHTWYPIFRTGFSEHYSWIISHPSIPSTETSLILLVAAIGTLCRPDEASGNEHDGVHASLMEAALSSMSSIITDMSLSSVQCLILLSIYNCCLLKPCHAHDMILIAAFKIQNLIRSVDISDEEERQSLARAYWTILLIESELSNHFDAPKSDIWTLDEHVPLPDSRTTWVWEAEVTQTSNSPLETTSITPGYATCTDVTDAYFLAAISMRRMLHRCNTAIRRSSSGSTVYAPRIAAELARQLDEWHAFLPNLINFDPNDAIGPEQSPLISFLHVQYHCYKIATYWPAAYQAMRDHPSEASFLEDCRTLLDSYTTVVPSLIESLRSCVINRWSLFATLFMNSMAVISIAGIPGLRVVCSPKLFEALSLASSTSLEFVRKSPSLQQMDEILRSRILHSCEKWLHDQSSTDLI